ncbi:hypothetical protein ABZ567_04120 [Streptomyces sp. NPDC016459]|uniref:hypothetical protein n=1 Tax=Streptomyces sp. NPDC016459 TaxID=3157190 RepID=UPI0033D30531
MSQGMTTGEILMARLRGEPGAHALTPAENPNKRVDQRSVEMAEEWFGGTHEEVEQRRSERQHAEAKARNAYEARVTKRARELRAQGENSYLADATARREIAKEDQAAREHERHRMVHEALQQNSKGERERHQAEELAQAPIRGAAQPGEPYVTSDGEIAGHQLDRVSSKHMARLFGSRDV